MQKRKQYTGEQKTKILRELLENNVPISQLCEQYKVRPNDIYNWKKKLFESAPNIFGVQSNKNDNKSGEQKKIEKLEATLRDRDEAISYLVSETISIKKSIDGSN
jgi:transposase-like protein